MRKVLQLIIIILVLANGLQAQTDSHFSLFEYAQGFFNPGATGTNNAMCVTSMHRQQWLGFGKGRPQTTVFSFDMPLANVLGVGLAVNNDVVGFENNLYLDINGAYHLGLEPGLLSFGLGLGIINKSIDPNWQTPTSAGGNPVYNDPLLPHMEKATAFDMNFGVSFIGKNYWAGLSVTHLLQPKIPYKVEKQSFLARHYYLIGGYTFVLPNPSFDIVTSGLVQSDGKDFTLQANVKVLYNKSFWGGLSLRYKDAVVPMVGVHLINGISIGYSYDILLKKVGAKNSGSHEIMLRYCFKMAKDNNPGKYRSVRRL